ncbi:hypothetical protein AVEN_215367-1 [Araneus ventricosus]|uniref:Uncharacterized protein n=1 Tax=Araneus ventricosus TaxID=182803 RepID=A0A4Y2W5A2_ARAVE|nr:hypothetical protein AVEN_215367-1 [Araneus ventricosus]
MLKHYKTNAEVSVSSFSSLQAILNPFTLHRLVRLIQDQLLVHKHVSIGWIKTHAGHDGNDAADKFRQESHLGRNSNFCSSASLLCKDLYSKTFLLSGTSDGNQPQVDASYMNLFRNRASNSKIGLD